MQWCAKLRQMCKTAVVVKSPVPLALPLAAVLAAFIGVGVEACNSLNTAEPDALSDDAGVLASSKEPVEVEIVLDQTIARAIALVVLSLFLGAWSYVYNMPIALTYIPIRSLGDKSGKIKEEKKNFTCLKKFFICLENFFIKLQVVHWLQIGLVLTGLLSTTIPAVTRVWCSHPVCRDSALGALQMPLPIAAAALDIDRWLGLARMPDPRAAMLHNRLGLSLVSLLLPCLPVYAMTVWYTVNASNWVDCGVSVGVFLVFLVGPRCTDLITKVEKLHRAQAAFWWGNVRSGGDRGLVQVLDDTGFSIVEMPEKSLLVAVDPLGTNLQFTCRAFTLCGNIEKRNHVGKADFKWCLENAEFDDEKDKLEFCRDTKVLVVNKFCLEFDPEYEKKLHALLRGCSRTVLERRVGDALGIEVFQLMAVMVQLLSHGNDQMVGVRLLEGGESVAQLPVTRNNAVKSIFEESSQRAQPQLHDLVVGVVAKQRSLSESEQSLNTIKILLEIMFRLGKRERQVYSDRDMQRLLEVFGEVVWLELQLETEVGEKFMIVEVGTELAAGEAHRREDAQFHVTVDAKGCVKSAVFAQPWRLAIKREDQHELIHVQLEVKKADTNTRRWSAEVGSVRHQVTFIDGEVESREVRGRSILAFTHGPMFDPDQVASQGRQILENVVISMWCLLYQQRKQFSVEAIGGRRRIVSRRAQAAQRWETCPYMNHQCRLELVEQIWKAQMLAAGVQLSVNLFRGLSGQQ